MQSALTLINPSEDYSAAVDDIISFEIELAAVCY
jgi:hypothetical protein